MDAPGPDPQTATPPDDPPVPPLSRRALLAAQDEAAVRDFLDGDYGRPIPSSKADSAGRTRRSSRWVRSSRRGPRS